MGPLGATIAGYDEDFLPAAVPVKTLKQACRFFCGIARFYGDDGFVAAEADEAWLLWLLSGHPAYAERMVEVVEFQVRVFQQYGRQAHGFSVWLAGAKAAEEFDYIQALRGEPETRPRLNPDNLFEGMKS